MPLNHYDYIIAGAGCAGLSLAMHILGRKELQQKQILLVDESLKNTNDRTWCFWEKKPGFFEPVVSKQWDQLWFQSNEFSKALSITPYQYKMIRGIDFYTYCLQTLRSYPNCKFIQGKVECLLGNENTGIVVDGVTFTATYVFNSIVWEKPTLRKKDVWLYQHFKGWQIETPEPVFNPDIATLMDFRVPQHRGTTFGYVLPLSPTTALIEYTLFTGSLLSQDEYDKELNTYIRQQLQIENFTVTETEYGIIPMTNYRFSKGHHNVIGIGTAGGQTKGSSGYTFYFIQEHCKKIVNRLSKNQHPLMATTSQRFYFYDSVLLQVLAQNELPGHRIFSTLFQKNKPQDVLAFLNNASSLSTELRILSTLPTLPFLKAALRQLF